jgi:serine acetyltransferase
MSVEVVKTFQGHSNACRGNLMRYLTDCEISHEKLMRYLTDCEISHEISHQAGLIEDHSIAIVVGEKD